MTISEFQAAAIALLRSAVGWQTAIARRMEIEPRTVRRWLANGSIPPWVAEKMRELMGGTDTSAWPRDEWIVGDGAGADGRLREYVVHTVPPRFVARIVECDAGAPEEADLPVDLHAGAIYETEVGTLCEVEWIDQPRPGEITALLEAAADAVERMAGLLAGRSDG